MSKTNLGQVGEGEGRGAYGDPNSTPAVGGKSAPGGGGSTEASTAHARIVRHKLAQKAWREKNKEYLREYMAQWKARNPERVRQYKHLDKRGESFPTLMGILAAQGGACALCGENLALARHLDHKIPKSRGGESRASNYQFLCPTCNMAKGALTNEEFLAHIGKILGRAL